MRPYNRRVISAAPLRLEFAEKGVEGLFQSVTGGRFAGKKDTMKNNHPFLGTVLLTVLTAPVHATAADKNIGVATAPVL